MVGDNINQEIEKFYQQRKLLQAREGLEKHIDFLTPNHLAGFLLKEVQLSVDNVDLNLIKKLLSNEKISKASAEIQGKILFELLNRDELFTHKLHSNFINNETLSGLCRYVFEHRKLDNKKGVIDKLGERIANQPRFLAHFLFLKGMEVMLMHGLMQNQAEIIKTFKYSFEIHKWLNSQRVFASDDIKRFIEAHFQVFNSKWGEDISADLVRELLTLARKTCDQRTVEVLEAFVNTTMREEVAAITTEKSLVVKKANQIVATNMAAMNDSRPSRDFIADVKEKFNTFKRLLSTAIMVMIIEPKAKSFRGLVGAQNMDVLTGAVINTAIRAAPNIEIGGGKKRPAIERFTDYLFRIIPVIRDTQGEKAAVTYTETIPAAVQKRREILIREAQYYNCLHSFYSNLLSLVNNPTEFQNACSKDLLTSDRIKGFFCHAIKNKLEASTMNLLVKRFYEYAAGIGLADKLCAKAVDAIYHEEFRGAEFNMVKESLVAAFLNNVNITNQYKKYVVEQMIREDRYFDLCIKVLGEKVKNPSFFKATLGEIIRDKFGEGPDKVIIDKIMRKGYTDLYYSIAEVIHDRLLFHPGKVAQERMKEFHPKLVASCIKVTDKVPSMISLYFKNNPAKGHVASVFEDLLRSSSNDTFDSFLLSSGVASSTEYQNAIIGKAIIQCADLEKFEKIIDHIKKIHDTGERDKPFWDWMKPNKCKVPGKEKLHKYGNELFELCAAKKMGEETAWELVNFSKEDVNPANISWALAFAVNRALSYDSRYAKVIHSLTGALAAYAVKCEDSTSEILNLTLRDTGLKLASKPDIVAFCDLFSTIESEHVHPNFKALLKTYIKQEDIHQVSDVIRNWFLSSAMPAKKSLTWER